MEKIFNQKSFNYFVWKLWVVKLTYRYFFSLKFTLRCKQSDILPLVSFIPVANLPLVWLTHVVRLDLRISPRFFRKIGSDPHVLFRGLGEDDSWKKSEAKILDTVPLNICCHTFNICWRLTLQEKIVRESDYESKRVSWACDICNCKRVLSVRKNRVWAYSAQACTLHWQAQLTPTILNISWAHVYHF